MLDICVEGYDQTRTMNPTIARADSAASELQPAPQSMPGMRHGTRSGLNYHPSELLSLPPPQPHTSLKHRHTYIHTNSDGEMNPSSRDSERYIRPLTPYHYVEEESENSIQSCAACKAQAPVLRTPVGLYKKIYYYITYNVVYISSLITLFGRFRNLISFHRWVCSFFCHPKYHNI